MQGEPQRIAEVVNSLHDLIESKQAGAEISIISLISTAGEIVLSLVLSDPGHKDAYLKAFNSAVEQVRTQLRQELKARKL